MPVMTLVEMTIAQVFLKTGYEAVILPVTYAIAKRVGEYERANA